MRSSLVVPFVLAVTAAAASARAQEVTFASLLREMTDLDRLTRLPDPDYRTVQWSSTDRRTKSPDEPGWFSNADGFGQEPIPGFEKVLKEPGGDGVGEYLLCDVDGPGAIVRGWSAGMDGVLRVWLDGGDKPLFEGKGYDFLSRRSSALVEGFAKLDENVRRLLQQEDADYLPIPFAQHLRVVWTGRVRDLHFYHLQVRRYAKGAKVVTPPAPPWKYEAPPQGALVFVEPYALITEQPADKGMETATAPFDIAPGGHWSTEQTSDGTRSLRYLAVNMPNADGSQLRSVRLRITCDGASQPQVDAPLGDFFGAFTDVTPSHSIAVASHGSLSCRWPMPYRRHWRIDLDNTGIARVSGLLTHMHAPLPGGFDDRTLYFHALWRVDHELSAQAAAAPIDLPFLTAIGQGRYVGCSVQIVNPPMAPSWRSNWWGEGDEKIFVDGKLAALGTGSEDFFNYSWSHWRYFSFPYCGQPLSTGPGNCGYVSNYRVQILDDLPFAQSFAIAMELWSHKPVHPLSYARTVYFYARPGVITDHRAIQPSELVLPKLSPWTDADFAKGEDAATWMPGARPDGFRASAGKVEPRAPTALTRSGAILQWQAPAGAELAMPFSVPQDGDYRLRVCCQERPDAPSLQARVDSITLRDDGHDTFPLSCVHGERFEDLVFDDATLSKGGHTLVLVCPQGGIVGVDLAGYELRPPKQKQLPGALEGELMDVIASSPGLDVEVQGMGSNEWSGMHQRWVKAAKPGDFAAFRVVAPKAGRYHVTLRLTQSWDYGIVRVDWNGSEAAKDVDLWCGTERRLGIKELDLGERDLAQPCELRLTVTGHAPGNEAPHCYFGVDCVVLTTK